MNTEWLDTTGDAVLMVIISAVGIYSALILFTKVVGLRSFSKMSGFDFAITVAFGSLLSTTILMKDPPLMLAVVALATLYLLQFVVAYSRVRSKIISKLVDNTPLLIMAGPEILHDNLQRSRMSEADLFSKLREANVCRLEQVRAVVMETTGDVSVLHAEPGAPPIDLELLAGVREVGRLRRSGH